MELSQAGVAGWVRVYNRAKTSNVLSRALLYHSSRISLLFIITAYHSTR